MEDSVYICGWRKGPEGFTLWTIGEPHVRISGETFALAEERLLKAIVGRGGAMCAVLELDPPLPKTDVEAQYALPELYLICGYDRFEIGAPRQMPFETTQDREVRLQWMDKLFERPVCRKCTHATSPRSAMPLPVSYAPARYDGAFGTVGGAHVEIVSEEFISLLTADERDSLILRPVNRKAKARQFYEILGPSGPPFVGATELQHKGWHCSECDYRVWAYFLQDFAIRDFIAAVHLPETIPGIFTVGSPPNIHLCVTGEKWRSLVGRKGVRGFVSHPLGVVKNGAYVLNPKLPTYEEASSS